MEKEIKIPENCPSCNSPLETVKDQLFCRNSLCPAQQQKIVEHFTKTLKIKGLGPATIEKLNLQCIPEIYSLTLDKLESVIGEKTARKVFQEIQDSKTAPLDELLAAFSIPLLGKATARKLCTNIQDIREITEETCKKAGLGPKVTINLLYWLNHEFSNYQDLGLSFKSNLQKTTKGVACITGKLTSYKTKAEAEQYLVSQGYEVTNNLSKRVTVLINESGTDSSKTEKAKKLNIPILTIKELKNGTTKMD